MFRFSRDFMVHLNFAVLLNKCSEQREAAQQLSLFKKKIETAQSFVDPEVGLQVMMY